MLAHRRPFRWQEKVLILSTLWSEYGILNKINVLVRLFRVFWTKYSEIGIKMDQQINIEWPSKRRTSMNLHAKRKVLPNI